MRPFARRLFALCSAASLLLCVAVCALWVRGARVSDLVHAPLGRSEVGLSNGPPGLDLSVSVYYAPRPPLFPEWIRQPRQTWFSPGRRAWVSVLGFRLGHSRDVRNLRGGPFGFDETFVVLPHWLLLLGAAALPATAAAARVRVARRLRAGRCTSCGYDLRASPGRCPECGAAGAVQADARGVQ